MKGVRCMVMRGGTSKGLYFLASELPEDAAARDRFLLRAMGSPDSRQIDGMGGADPLTSKVAVVGASTKHGADVDYLFLQVVVNEARVDDSQNCGNILAGVGYFAIERGLVAAQAGTTQVGIHMANTSSLAVATIETPGAAVRYEGEAHIDGVPGTAAPVLLDFCDVAGSSCGALLPTGKPRDTVGNVVVTCIDNGMPVVLISAAEFGLSGFESPSDLENDSSLKRRIEEIRLLCGPMMNLGNVTSRTVPKMCLIAPPQRGGTISTRTFIPRRVHQSIGVFGALSVATACAVPGSVAEGLADIEMRSGRHSLDVEHPTGFFTVKIEVATERGGIVVSRSAFMRTARKLMDGIVYAPVVVGSQT